MQSLPPVENVPAAASMVLPAALVMSRYEALTKKSPFTTVAVEETVGFAQDLLLAGYVRLKGEYFVMVASRTSPTRFLVGKKESPSAQGLVLVEVLKDPKGDPAKMKAKIKKGSEIATLSYEVAAAASQPPPAPIPGQAPPGAPVLPGQPNPAQVQAGQNRPGPAPVIRRRVIPIPSAPAR